MDFLSNCMKGIAIGAGAILPGVSSGVLCVIFGIYEKLLDSVLNFFKDVKNNIKFLLPIAIGVFIGVLIFSKLISYLFYAFPIQTQSIFIGLILGSIPSLINQMHKKRAFKLRYILYLLLALSVGVLTVVLEKNISHLDFNNFSFMYLIISGFCMSVGVIVPGVSNTIILMLLGVYSTYLNSLSLLYLPVLIPMGIGLLAGGFIFMKLTKFLLEHFYGETFYAIIGFTIGSIFILFPEFSFSCDWLISVLCVICGYSISQILTFSSS